MTPTTDQINANIIAQLEAKLNQTIPLAPRAFTRVLSRALAGVYVLLYKYAGWMTLQIFVPSASLALTEVNGAQVSPLREWGALIGVGDPAAATSAEFLVDVTVENQGGTLPSGSQLRGDANGVIYLTIGAVALSAATVSATVRAVTAGTTGNLEVGQTLNFANPLLNVSRETTITTLNTTGADAETETAYRTRILDRFQKQPQGGASADYEQWGEAVAGVLNVYPYPGVCPGQVDIYVESSTEVDGIPTAAQLQAVLDAVELDENGLASRRPIGALPNTYPITRLGFDVTIEGLSVEDPAAVQADITASVEAYFLSRAPFIAGLSVPPRNDRITQSGVAGVVDDIVSAAGGVFSSVSVALGALTVTIYALDQGEKAKALSLTFV